MCYIFALFYILSIKTLFLYFFYQIKIFHIVTFHSTIVKQYISLDICLKKNEIKTRKNLIRQYVNVRNTKEETNSG